MRLTRHAKNNMRLYNILEMDIVKAIESPDSTDRESNKSIVLKSYTDKFSGFPLKVVYEEIGDEVMIVTAYPLKKKHWR